MYRFMFAGHAVANKKQNVFNITFFFYINMNRIQKRVHILNRKNFIESNVTKYMKDLCKTAIFDVIKFSNFGCGILFDSK